MMVTGVGGCYLTVLGFQMQWTLGCPAVVSIVCPEVTGSFLYSCYGHRAIQSLWAVIIQLLWVAVIQL